MISAHVYPPTSGQERSFVRRIITTCVFIAAACLLAPARGPSIEQLFVATTEAADETEGAMCLIPEGVEGPPKGGHYDGIGGSAVGPLSDVVSGFSRTDGQQ